MEKRDSGFSKKRNKNYNMSYSTGEWAIVNGEFIHNSLIHNSQNDTVYYG